MFNIFKTYCSTLCIFLITLYFVNAKNISTDYNDTKEDSLLVLEGETRVDLYDDQEIKWIRSAVVSVGYYLRLYKFSEWDKRHYKERPNETESNMYESFPNPPLSYFHWDVFSHCQSDFLTCLRYLHETVVDAYAQHSYDTIYVLRKQNISLTNPMSNKIMQIQSECERLHEQDEKYTVPFKGVVDKFQWLVTASYYMCMFTLNEVSELKNFNEPCDNFAKCLHRNGSRVSTSNYDLRANDTIPFSCARYSFCPDPCCKGTKVVKQWKDCWTGLPPDNSCRDSSSSAMACSLNATINRSLVHMAYNLWNTTCNCSNPNFVWSSRSGMCIDYNECVHRQSTCNKHSEFCLNLKGGYTCKCRFGFKWSTSKSSCIKHNLLIKALKRFDSRTHHNEACEIINTPFLIIITILSSGLVIL